MSIVNFSITKPLEKKVNQAIKMHGFASKAEFFRFAVMQYIRTLRTDISQEELEESIEALRQTMIKKFADKKFPSLEEQLADLR